ncbi:hypothetical protein C8R43DRAFT_1128750 [Mycena crocata]|nr:hypothetical protein C8R43DRAFT_1128750 [Mycena crocata]
MSTDSPYAEAQPPPPPKVMLLSATDLHLPASRLISHEDLVFTSASDATTQDKEGTTAPSTVTKPSKVTKALTFAELDPKSIHTYPPKPSSSRQSDPPSGRHGGSTSPLTDLGEILSSESSGSDVNMVPAKKKIACPTGLTSKSLAEHKEWTEKEEVTQAITLLVHKLADKYLDIEDVLANQDSTIVKDVCRRAKVVYPILNSYGENWPTRCILHAHLNITKKAAESATVSRLRNKKIRQST